MAKINHHIPKPALKRYLTGALDQNFAVVAAAHIAVCDACRAEVEAFDAVGSVIDFADLCESEVSSALWGRVAAAAFADSETTKTSRAVLSRADVLAEAQSGWRSLAPGIKQKILRHDGESSLRLLEIQAGIAVPEHSHHGEEWTLVLDGAFRDETGEYRAGDLEGGDHDLHHQPIAIGDRPCLCLAANTGKLAFRGLVPRVLQPIFRI